MITKFRKFKSIKNNKEAKVLAENFVALSFLKLAGYIFPLITLPYLARIIGVKAFGDIAFAASVIVYFSTLTDFGFNYTATRDVAQNRDDKDYVSKIFSNVLVAKLILMFISLIIFVICVYSFPILREKSQLMWATFMLIPGYILFPEWFFQSMEKMKYITVLNLVSKLVFTILVFVLIKKQSDYILQPILIACGYLVSGVLALYVIFNKFKIKFILPSIGEMKQTFRGSANMFAILFFPNLYTNFSVILLKMYGGSVATGLYSSGYKFIELSDQFSQILSRTFYPFLARHIEKHRLYVKISGLINITACFCLFFGADFLVKLFYTSEFKSAALVIKIMSLTPFFFYLMGTYGTNYLVLVGKEKILRNIIVLCSIGGFVLSWVLVIPFNYIGIALTLTIVWGVRGGLTWLYALKFKNQN